MKTELQKKKHADYMREYNRRNKDRISKQRRERRLKNIEHEKKLGRVRNRRYYAQNKDEINARAKAGNWNYDPVKRKEIRKRHYDKNPAKVVLKQRKCQAKKKGLPWDLTERWYYEHFENGCSVTGIPFDINGSKTPWCPHIDRIVPEKGYLMNNCRLVCACYNQAKGQWSDEDVMKMAYYLIRTSDA